MSSEHSSNSVYGTDSIPEFLESSQPINLENNDTVELYSSSSSIDVTASQTEAEASKSEDEKNKSKLARTESIKSLWSTSDASLTNTHNKNEISSDDHTTYHKSKILPNEASPFIYDGRIITYNEGRGVQYKTPLVLGSRKLAGRKGECGYHATHLVFDPTSGSLAAGCDVDNGWTKLPNFSLITGIGNTAELDASFVSGSHNKIKLEMLPVSSNKTEKYCLIPPSCSIVGGSHNTIANTSACQHTSAIIGSHGVSIKDSETTVVLGMKSAPGQHPFHGFHESTITRNLYSLGHTHIGPLLSSDLPKDTVLSANGDAYINGNLSVTGHVNSESATFETIFAATGSFQHISASNIDQYSIFVEGISGNTGITGSDIVITRGDGVNIVYANPAPGDIRIKLGSGDNPTFESNRQLVVKDVSLEFGPGSSHNVYVWVPNGIRIEHYKINGGSYGMTASEAGIYVINSSGGSVTLRYMAPLFPGALPTWTIENQLLGNPRLLNSTGIRFVPASDDNRYSLLRRN